VLFHFRETWKVEPLLTDGGRLLLCPAQGALRNDVRLTSVCLFVAYIGLKSRTQRPRKPKIGTEVAHVTRDSETTFEVKKVTGQLAGLGGGYCDGLPHSLSRTH